MPETEHPLALLCAFGEGEDCGVISYRFDPEAAALQPVSHTQAENAYFIASHPENPWIYTTDWVDDGTVSAYRLDSDTGALTLLNRRSSRGEIPCYVSVASGGDYAFVANYTGGNVAMFPIESDGQLGRSTSVVQHEGSSVNPQRQTAPHPHAILPGPDDRFVYVPDLGLDRVLIYRVDRETGELRSGGPSDVTVDAGAGPRHMVFHPMIDVAYVINELNSTISVFGHDPTSGALDERQQVTTLPSSFHAHNYCADVRVHPSGRFLYATNRGADSVALFMIDQESGHLTPRGHAPSGGHYPQDLAIDPTGEYLFTQNRRTDTVGGFRIDGETGDLERRDCGTLATVPSTMIFTGRYPPNSR